MKELKDNFEPRGVVKYTIKFIQDIIDKRKAEGLLVIFSGQLDSYVTAKMAIETMGVEKVKLIVLSTITDKRREEIIAKAIKDLKISRKNIYSYSVTKIMKELEID